MKFVDVKNDVAFHKIFGNANKTVTLISFLNAVLYLDGSNRVVSVTIESPHLFPPVPAGKTSIFCAKVTDSFGRKFIVEVQFADEAGFNQRIQLYTLRDHATDSDRIHDYRLFRPSYFISILDFDFTQNPNYFSTHQTIDTETGENLLKDVKYFFIELKKFDKLENELVTMVDKWTYFIKNAKNLEVIPSNVDDEGLKTAYLDADQQTWTKAEREAYDDFGIYLTDIKQRELFLLKQGEAKGMEKGLEKGLEKGEQKKEIEMILAMHDANLPFAQIATISGKSEAEVREMIANQKR